MHTNHTNTLGNEGDNPYLYNFQFCIHRILPIQDHKDLLCATQVYDFWYIWLLSQFFIHIYHNLKHSFCINHNYTPDNERDNPYLYNLKFCIHRILPFQDHKDLKSAIQVYDLKGICIKVHCKISGLDFELGSVRFIFCNVVYHQFFQIKLFDHFHNQQSKLFL